MNKKKQEVFFGKLKDKNEIVILIMIDEIFRLIKFVKNGFIQPLINILINKEKIKEMLEVF